MNQDDQKLSSLLRQARGAPELPPRFQQQVWQRIDRTRAPAPAPRWLEMLVEWWLRPRWALATAALLLIAGAWLGAQAGSRLARQDAQARYLATVAPESLRGP